MRSHIGWRGNEAVEASSLNMRFKTVRLIVIHYRPKRIISISGGLELLQMILELDIGWYANEEGGGL